MDFKETPAIYLQISEYVCEQILLKKWNLGDKIISIRDLAIIMEVNPNTVQRAYDFLQQRDIIINKRGVGYFIDNDAMDRILAFRREQFMKNELPVFFKNNFEGIIEKGTPIAQILPFKTENWLSQTDKEILEKSQINDMFAATKIFGWYKKNIWKKKSYE